MKVIANYIKLMVVVVNITLHCIPTCNYVIVMNPRSVPWVHGLKSRMEHKKWRKKNSVPIVLIVFKQNKPNNKLAAKLVSGVVKRIVKPVSAQANRWTFSLYLTQFYRNHTIFYVDRLSLTNLWSLICGDNLSWSNTIYHQYLTACQIA